MLQDKRLIESLCDLQIPSVIRFSPDGSKLVYATQLSWSHRKGETPVSSLWIATPGVEGSAHKITSGEFHDHEPAWRPNGLEVAFISDRAAAGKKSALYLTTSSDGAAPQAITPVENEQPITAFAFSPNGKSIAYICGDEKPKSIDATDAQVWGAAWSFARLRVIDIETKQVRTVALERNVYALAWSQDGDHIAFIASRNTDLEDRYIDGGTLSTVDPRTLTTVRDVCWVPGNVSSLAWSKDQKIYIPAGVPIDSHLSGHGIYACAPQDENTGPKWIEYGEEEDVEKMIEAQGTIVTKLDVGVQTRLALMDGITLFSTDQEVMTFDVHFSDDKTVLAVVTSNINQPMELFTIEVGHEKMTQLSKHGEPFEHKNFGHCSVLTVPSTDGQVEFEALYIAPWNATKSVKPEKPLPTAVLIHGGPNSRVANAFNAYYFYLAPYLLSRGYGILLPNYRGSSGRGRAFAEADIDNIGTRDYIDVIAATQYATENGYADKDNLFVGGYSHGGFLTFCCAVRNGWHGHGWHFKAAWVGAGIGDADSMALTSDLGLVYFAGYLSSRVPWSVDRDDTKNRAASPLWDVKEAVERSRRTGEPGIPPVLIIHGDKDDRCHVSQAWGIRRALQSHKLPYEYVTYPGEGHFLGKQKNWIDLTSRVGAWCDKHLDQTKLSVPPSFA